ncbi:U-box domain-containing protein 35-like [Solanum stenotomum]|uniref:U-box domain-containing protein 35-like n=1 Tax=Solanum stenotomum TaxID=172797 RepID=UPI0020CFECED|nr:U-box domain-containing protein 35-like [Solanum stenotomum]
MVSLQGLNEERLVAVAIDKNKGSQYALRWATENVLTKGQKVTLLHVPQTQTTSAPQSPTECNNVGGNDSSIGQDSNSQCTDLFLPFRVFCSFKEIAYDLIILEGQDIAKSLIDYVSLYRVQNLILGCPSKNGISRLFTKSEVANTVMKKAPSFCNIYIVSKGKISSTRMASHPLKRRFSNPSIRVPPQRNSNFDATNLMSRVSISTNKTSDDQVYVAKADNSFSGSDRMSTDSTLFLDCYDNLGSEVHSHRPSVSMDSKNVGELTRLSGFGPTRLADHIHSTNDFLLSEQKCEENPLSSDKIKEMGEKLRRLELQTIQTMEMYHAACKEALREKQKLKELENLRKEDVKKLEEARREKEEALDRVAKEKALRIASKEEAKAAQRKAEREAQKRKRFERKALKKSEAKKSTIKSLVHSQKAIKYQSLLRILVVSIIFYLYFFALR